MCISMYYTYHFRYRKPISSVQQSRVLSLPLFHRYYVNGVFVVIVHFRLHLLFRLLHATPTRPTPQRDTVYRVSPRRRY